MEVSPETSPREGRRREIWRSYTGRYIVSEQKGDAKM